MGGVRAPLGGRDLTAPPPDANCRSGGGARRRHRTGLRAPRDLSAPGGGGANCGMARSLRAAEGTQGRGVGGRGVEGHGATAEELTAVLTDGLQGGGRRNGRGGEMKKRESRRKGLGRCGVR